MDHDVPPDLLASWQAMKGPGYRWWLANQAAAGAAPGSSLPMDPLTGEAANFLRRVSNDDGLATAEQPYPRIAAAVALEEDLQKASALRILVLGGCDPEEIAARLAVDQEAVATWEAMFFDVRESREAMGWIHAHVIQPEHQRGNHALAGRLKLAAVGGPVVARGLLDAGDRAPVSAGERLFRKKLALAAKYEQALAMPLESSRDAIRYQRVYLGLVLSGQRLELQRKRLELRAQEAIRRAEMGRRRKTAASPETAGRQAVAKQGADDRQIAAEQEADLRRVAKARARAVRLPLAELRWGSGAGSPGSAPCAPSAHVVPRSDRLAAVSSITEGDPATTLFAPDVSAPSAPPFSASRAAPTSARRSSKRRRRDHACCR